LKQEREAFDRELKAQERIANDWAMECKREREALREMCEFADMVIVYPGGHTAQLDTEEFSHTTLEAYDTKARAHLKRLEGEL
jgi:hypothetical protein